VSNEVVLAQALRVVCTAHFSGTETKDPRLFLLELRRFFARGHIDDPMEQTHQALERLQGRAASWGNNFKIFPIPFREFARRLLETFDSTESQVKVRAQFYGQKQSSGETADSFIARKRALSARMTFRDQLSEEKIVSTIITQLLPDLRSRLRFAKIRTCEELLSAAELLENDLREIQRFTQSQLRSPAHSRTNHPVLPSQTPEPHPETSQGARRPERRLQDARKAEKCVVSSATDRTIHETANRVRKSDSATTTKPD